MAERNGTKNDQQSTTHKTEDGATGTVLKSRVAQEWYLSINLSVAVAVLDSWFVSNSKGL